MVKDETADVMSRGLTPRSVQASKLMLAKFFKIWLLSTFPLHISITEFLTEET